MYAKQPIAVAKHLNTCSLKSARHEWHVQWNLASIRCGGTSYSHHSMRERVSKINVKESLLAVNLNEGKNIRRVCELFFLLLVMVKISDSINFCQSAWLKLSLIHTYIHTQRYRQSGEMVVHVCSIVIEKKRLRWEEMRLFFYDLFRHI